MAAFLPRTSGLDTTHIDAYTGLINGLVADNLWTKFDVLHIYATQNSTTALLNLVSTSYNGTANGSPAFAADLGFTGVEPASGTYIDTGFIASSASSPKYARDSAHLSAWNLTNTTTAGGQVGELNAGATTVGYIITKFTDGKFYARLNDDGSDGGVLMADARGHFIGNRSASNAKEFYKNGGAPFTNSTVSNGLPNVSMTSLGANFNGTAGVCAHQTAMISIGSSLTGADATNFYNRLRAYMTAVGVP